jgi:alkylhydroperoxidase family enzyme
MPFMPSMPTDALVKDVYSINPQTFRHWLHVEEAIMRGPSAFTAGEREFIAAYVSRLNRLREARLHILGRQMRR